MEARLIHHRAAALKDKIRRLRIAYRQRHPSSDLLFITTPAHYPHSAASDSASASASSSDARGCKSISTNLPLMQLMKYGIPTVLILITLKYQGNTNSIFYENPVPLWCFITATLVYWLIIGAMKQVKTTINHKRMIFFLTLLSNASAFLSLISLVAMFLPYPLSLLPYALIISSLLSLALLYGFCLFLSGIQIIANKMLDWARGGRNLTEEASARV